MLVCCDSGHMAPATPADSMHAVSGDFEQARSDINNLDTPNHVNTKEIHKWRQLQPQNVNT